MEFLERVGYKNMEPWAEDDKAKSPLPGSIFLCSTPKEKDEQINFDTLANPGGGYK
jgi:hypothetical protein